MTDQGYREIDLASVDHVLKTTRSVRQRLDLTRPVPVALIKEALDVALQAPTGANTQTWRFLVVTDAAIRARIADCYRRAAAAYIEGKTAMSRTGVSMMREYAADDPRQQQREAMIKSGGYLMENLQR
ncbi:MAG: nitroreductase family protein, partial [Gammaproteobacteria bacterium]